MAKATKKPVPRAARRTVTKPAATKAVAKKATAKKPIAKRPPARKTAVRKTAGSGRAPGKAAAGPFACPAVGTQAPDFTLESTAGRPIRLSDYRGRKTLVLYFYPKDNTPGCTAEACGFRDRVRASPSEKVEVLGVSCDSLASHEKFKSKFGLPFPLLSDPQHKVAEAYGVWRKKRMAGREYMGVVRTTFVIDRAGRVANVYENVKVEGHHDAVFAWIDANL